MVCETGFSEYKFKGTTCRVSLIIKMRGLMGYDSIGNRLWLWLFIYWSTLGSVANATIIVSDYIADFPCRHSMKKKQFPWVSQENLYILLVPMDHVKVESTYVVRKTVFDKSSSKACDGIPWPAEDTCGWNDYDSKNEFSVEHRTRAGVTALHCFVLQVEEVADKRASIQCNVGRFYNMNSYSYE